MEIRDIADFRSLSAPVAITVTVVASAERKNSQSPVYLWAREEWLRRERVPTIAEESPAMEYADSTPS